MFRSILLGLLAFWAQIPANAGEAFRCGEAEVRLDILGRQSKAWELRAEAVLTVTAEGHSTVLRYRGSIDFIGAECFVGADGKPKVVYQAFCGGSGCMDLDNWGIVHTRSLQVMLVPSDGNRKEAARLLGRPLPEIRRKLNIWGEARKQGIDVPE